MGAEQHYPVPDHPGIGGGPPSAAEEAFAKQAHADGYRAGVEAVKKAILDIDAHATALGEDDDGFVSGGYVITVGCLHRALGIIGHSAPKCRLCDPSQHECLTAWGALAAAAVEFSESRSKGLLERAHAEQRLVDAVARYQA